LSEKLKKVRLAIDAVAVTDAPVTRPYAEPGEVADVVVQLGQRTLIPVKELRAVNLRLAVSSEFAASASG
jgi:hypothetical protein